MARSYRLAAALLILWAMLVPATKATAGPLTDWLLPDDGPEPSYSHLRYLAPALAHLHDNCHGPKLNIYPPDRHPEIPPTYTVLTFPCPPVAPGATIIPIPTPPATSKFKY
jgi:hypothetical protein